MVFCLVTVRSREMSLAMSESLDSRRKREVFDLRDLFSRSDVLLISSMRSGSGAVFAWAAADSPDRADRQVHFS